MTDDRDRFKGPPPPPPPAPPPLPSQRTPARRTRGSQGGQRMTWIVFAVLGMFTAGFVGWALSSFSRSDDPRQSGERRIAAQPKQTPNQPPLDDGSNAPAVATEISPIPAKQPQTQPAIAETPKPPTDRASEDPQPSPPETKPAPPEPKDSLGTDLGGKSKPTSSKSATQTLYQEVIVWRRPTFIVSGITISQDLKYRVLSKLRIRKGEDGTRDVKQEIYETELQKADGLSRAMFAESLKKMQGETFSFTVNAKGEIVKFAGPKDNRKNIKVDGVGDIGGQGFLMSSVMDEDGWKELAQLCFLLPEKPIKTMRKGQRWERKFTHDWGSLGSWYGKTIYQHAGVKDGEHRIDYVHRLTYVPPGKGKKQKKSPLQITSAAFKPIQAKGEVYFSAAQGRVVRAREWFHVRGVASITVLGQSTQVQVEEMQYFSIRVIDKLSE